MSSEPAQSNGPRGRPAEILLVEDNYGDVLLAQEAFRIAKIANNMTVAQDGEMALQILNRVAPFEDKPKPDLILLDLNLPKRDGREVLESVKSDPNLKKIPVVVLTGSRAESEIARSYALHANAYIVKPVNFERLKDIVAVIQNFWFTVVVLSDDAKKE